MTNATRSPFSCSVAATCLLIAIGMLPDAMALTLTIDPAAPSCEAFTLEATVSYADSCWHASSEFVVGGSSMGFDIDGTDGWMPGMNCADVITVYSFSETLEVPSGRYWAWAREETSSSRFPPVDDYVSFSFLACCPGREAQVTDLVLEKVNGGNGVRFTWTDGPGVQQYRLYYDLSAAGIFDALSGVSDTGDYPGIYVHYVLGSRFFLLATGSDCGEGSKHWQP